MKGIIEYLELSALKYPEKTAVSCNKQSYTYKELLSVSRKIGYTINNLSNNMKGQAVGVICERNINCLAYFFGIVYSGNYYVPIDPDMPGKKKKDIIEDANISVILGDKSKEETLKEFSFSGNYISSSDMSEKECEAIDINKDFPLYMVYTSGSTGKPKGVLKSHTSIISFINAYVNTFDFSNKEIIGNQTPFFFDASAKDIYLSLYLGATLEIIPTEFFAMPPTLIEFLNEKKVTFISWVPTALTLVAKVKTFSYVLPEYLTKVFFVGEVMPIKHLNYWMRYLPNIKYVNLYGQSELSGICCFFEIKKEYDDLYTLPIGKPLLNCEIYLLDKEKIICEPNHIGEMYIVSDALALEYYNDSEKTKNNFIEKNFGKGTVRCFKTGDLAKYDEMGNIVFASRNDYQIKHMGRRIELGEIETVAMSIDDVVRCACLYNTDAQKIILFVELLPESSETVQEIRTALKMRLSNYMLPGKIIVLDKIPLNANGKINRTLLKDKI